MKPSSYLFAVALILASAGVIHAQSNQTYDGGANTWDQGTTADWDGANVWAGGNDVANFNGASNTVTVSGTVTVDQMVFTSGGTTISGGTIEENPFTTPNFAPGTNPGDETLLQDFQNGATVTINSQIVVSDLGPNQQTYIANNGDSNLTINNIDFGAYTVNPAATTNRRINFNASGSGAISLNGTYTTSAGYGGTLNFGTNGAGTYNITSNADFSTFTGGAFGFYGNALNIDNSTFTGSPTLAFGNATANSTVNIVGAQTIALNVYDSMKYGGPPADDGVNITGVATFNQSTAALSTWTGNINQDGSSVALSAVSGGRLNWGALLYGDGPEGLTISGNGVVVLSNAGGNTYDERDGNGNLQPTSLAAATINSGATVLIANTSGSAFGISSNNNGNYPGGSRNNPVNLLGGGTLGGSGISAQQVIAMAATSVIAPGDPGQAGLGINPSIATLTLSGGLTTTASNGFTMDFKFSGLTNDQLVVGTAFTLSGPISVNLTNIGNTPLALLTPYTLATGSGTWNDTGAVFSTITQPDGYIVNTAYGVNGYLFDATNHTLTTEFLAVPEPSTYAMMLAGLGFLGFCLRRRTLRVG